MRKEVKEIVLLVVMPLILMSMSLAIIGTSHTIKMANVNRLVKPRQDSINMPMDCSNYFCQDIMNLKNIFFELDDKHPHKIST